MVPAIIFVVAFVAPLSVMLWAVALWAIRELLK